MVSSLLVTARIMSASSAPAWAAHPDGRRDRHGAHIEAILQLLQDLRLVVDNRDVVGLAGQILGDRGADLAGAEDDDLHGTRRGATGSVDIAALLDFDAQSAQLAIEVGAFHADLFGQLADVPVTSCSWWSR